MNDHPTPISDEELSAALDGEADDALQARIDASSEATARLAELRAAAARIGDAPVPPLDPTTVDDLIATALDAPVAPARPAGASRRGPAPWLVAAGVAVLMAIGLTLIWAGRSDQSDLASSSAKTADESTELADEGAGSSADGSFSGHAGAESQSTTSGDAADNEASAPSSTRTAVPASYVGTFASGDELREALGVTDAATAWTALASAFDKSEGMTPPTAAALDRCQDQLEVTLELEGPPIQTGWAQVDGNQVLVYEFATTSLVDDTTETSLVAAVGAEACDQVVFFER